MYVEFECINQLLFVNLYKKNCEKSDGYEKRMNFFIINWFVMCFKKCFYVNLNQINKLSFHNNLAGRKMPRGPPIGHTCFALPNFVKSLSAMEELGEKFEAGGVSGDFFFLLNPRIHGATHPYQ